MICFSINIQAYPLGLDLIGPIQSSGSDAQSQAFNRFSPSLNSLAGGNKDFDPKNNAEMQIIIDPSNVLMNSDANVRIYFFGNNSPFQNSIGFSPSGSLNDASLIFPNASRSPANPNDKDARIPGLSRGDFVDLGTLKSGTPFDLFLAADAADGNNKGVFWLDNSLNDKGASQAKMVQFIGTNYYLIGWEDLPLSSSDKDFNDVYIVAEIVAIPEPHTYLIFGILSLICLFFLRSRKAGPPNLVN
ncbi:MAG: DUF4114 domain-containing protein [Parachlamydiaceae bacterium]